MTQTTTTTTAPPSAPATPPASGWSRLLHSREFVIGMLAVILIVIFALTLGERFLSTSNIWLMLTSAAPLFVVALGLTFVLLIGAFDLSIGALLALCGYFFAYAYGGLGLPIGAAIVLTVVFGAVVGAVTNGVLIGYFGANFMVVTLGTMTLFQGITLWVSGGTTKTISSPWLLNSFAFGTIGGPHGIPIPVLLAVVLLGVTYYALNHTLFGRDVYAVGGNADAARLAGINTRRVTVAVFAIAGAAAAVGTIILAARAGSASATVGDQIMLQAAAAVLVGGTSLRGGSGGVIGTAIGVLFFGILSNGLQLAGIGSEWQQIISGAIVVGAALADVMQRRGFAIRRSRWRRSATPTTDTPTERTPV